MGPSDDQINNDKDEAKYETTIKADEILEPINMNEDEKLIKVEEPYCIQEEFEGKLKQELSLKDSWVRRHSSVSDGKAKMEMMETLLKDDDKDIEDMRSENIVPPQLKTEKNEEDKSIEDADSEYKNLPDYSSIDDEIIHNQTNRIRSVSEGKSSISNSSMDMSSDSSSDSKLQNFNEEDNFDSQDLINFNRDLLEEKYDSIKSNIKRKRAMNKSVTLPQMKLEEGNLFENKMMDFDRFDQLQIPLKKSVSGARQSIFNKSNNEGIKLVLRFNLKSYP